MSRLSRLGFACCAGVRGRASWTLRWDSVFCVFSVADDNIFETLTLYLELEHGERFLRVDMGHGKIQGLGKGAWTKRKATCASLAKLALLCFFAFLLSCEALQSALHHARQTLGLCSLFLPSAMACWIRESALYPRGPVKPIAYKAFSFSTPQRLAQDLAGLGSARGLA